MRTWNPSRALAWLLLASVLLAGATGSAGAAPEVASKPFAEHFLVLQLSDGEPGAQDRVLSVAGNVLEHYGPDIVDIEIVAFGPGIRLLYADNERAELIASLAAQGVRFVGCLNTLDTIERRTGERPETVPEMIPVQTGVAHILEQDEAGYTLVRP